MSTEGPNARNTIVALTESSKLGLLGLPIRPLADSTWGDVEEGETGSEGASRRETTARERRLLPLPTGAEQRLRELEATAVRPGLLWPHAPRRHDAFTHALAHR
ncbi:hypothetical protein [Streptomyces olivoreticuli]|uniref:hypothetical protein n=1 Tax=Streptomyces olivoreticuli TaxID=68246 RepID=UPI000E2891D1|nr:hypothetical protein [Streptomyces olivoreticuli]